MSEPEDDDRSSTRKELTAQERKRSGRVSFDERGNSVWEWQLETGVYSRDVSTQKLKKLELDELSIAETAVIKRPTGLAGGEKSVPGAGVNPYNSTPVVRGASPYDTARAMGDKLRLEPEPRKRRTLDDMRKLSEQIKKKEGPLGFPSDPFVALSGGAELTVLAYGAVI
jgi:hypothetical protein